MTRFLLWIGVILASIAATITTVVHDTHDWVERLNDPHTFTVVATNTQPIQLEDIPRVTTKSVTSTSTEHVIPSSAHNQKKTTTKPIQQSLPPQSTPTSVQVPAQTLGPQHVGDINEKAIIDLTNAERVRDGQSILSWNSKLSQMALMKAKDMLEKQYFAHESPQGRNVVGLASDAGYLYRFVGENLAVGNFRTNEELIAGWMGSPGHRENMLKPEYTEMGVATIEGVFEGEKVWMAVQEFGTPLPSCPRPDASQKTSIDSIELQLKSLEESILVAERVASETVGEAQRQKIDDYNALVNAYNSLVAEVKALIASYNDSVRAYNACIES